MKAGWILEDSDTNMLGHSFVKACPHASWTLSVESPEPSELQWNDLPKSYRSLLLYNGQTIKMDQVDNISLSSGKHIIKIVLDALSLLPSKTRLLANYPNLFNPETWIPYELSKDTDVKVMIYSSTGQLIRNLDLGYKHAGSYINKTDSAYWDGKNEVGEDVVSGVYFYTLVTSGFTQTSKFVIMR